MAGEPAQNHVAGVYKKAPEKLNKNQSMAVALALEALKELKAVTKENV